MLEVDYNTIQKCLRIGSSQKSFNMGYRIQIGERIVYYNWSLPVIDKIKEYIPEIKDILIGYEERKRRLEKIRLIEISKKIKTKNNIREPLKEAIIELENIVNEAVKSEKDLIISHNINHLCC
jgi:hypothetical protein